MSFDSVRQRLVTPCRTVLFALMAVTASSRAMAQTHGAEVGGHVGVLRLSELDTTDVGVGADAVWHVAPALGIDGAFTWFPGSDTSTGGSGRRQQRTLGLAGLRTGVSAGAVDLFARGRAGFLRFGSESATACILIFPTPLVCQLAGGYTAFAADVGGGASVAVIPSGRLRASVSASDLMVRYGFQALRPNGTTTEGFISHNLLLTIGAAWQF